MMPRYSLRRGLRDARRLLSHPRFRTLALFVSFVGAASCDSCPNIAGPKKRHELRVAAGPDNQRIAQGGSSTYTVTVTRTGFTGAVTLAPSAVDAVKGVTVTFSPQIVPPGITTSVATVTVASDATVLYDSGSGEPSTIYVPITATSADGLQGQAVIGVTVAPSNLAAISINVAPTDFVINVGESSDGTITLTRFGNYGGKVSLSLVGTLPGVTATITPLSNADTYRLRFETTAATPAQLNPMVYTIRAVPAGGIATVSTNLTVYITHAVFNPDAGRIPVLHPGDQDTVTVLLHRSSGLRGPIALTVDSAFAGITGTFAPNPALDDASVLTLRATAAVPVGQYTVRIHGVPAAGSGAKVQDRRIDVVVDLPVVVGSYTLSAPSLAVTPGAIVSADFGVSRTGSFTAPVSVVFTTAAGAPLPAGLTVSLDQNPITQSVTTVRITATSAVAPGTYALLATGSATGAPNATSPFNVLVNAVPRATSITVVKVVNGTPQATTAETVAVGASVTLVPVVLDQNGQPMTTATVTWSSANSGVASVTGAGIVTGVASGTTQVTVKSTANSAVAASVSITVPTVPVGTVTRIELEPQNAELTAPATQQYQTALFNAAGSRVTPDAGTSLFYSSSNTAVATVNPTTGVVTGVGAGISTITVRLMRGTVILLENSSPLTVYAAGSMGHYGSATISTGGDARVLRAGASLLFQIIVRDVSGNVITTGVNPAPVVTSSNAGVISIAPDGSPGGYFFTMNASAGAVAGTTVRIRYDVMGAGGEIIMTIVP